MSAALSTITQEGGSLRSADEILVIDLERMVNKKNEISSEN